MSGFCSAHMGHDPSCARCAASPPEVIRRAKEYEKTFTHGARRGAEAVAEWLEGAQWDDSGQPVPTDALKLADEATLKKLAAMVRERFAVREDFGKGG